MLKLNSTTEFYEKFSFDLKDFLVTNNLAVDTEDGIVVMIPKLDFNRIVKAQFDLTSEAFGIIINDGKIRYDIFEDPDLISHFNQRCVGIFCQKLEKRKNYIKSVVTDYPYKVYSVESDNISGELREHLIGLGV